MSDSRARFSLPEYLHGDVSFRYGYSTGPATHPGCHLLASFGVLLFIELAEDVILARLDACCGIEPSCAGIGRANRIHVSQELGRRRDQVVGSDSSDWAFGVE